MAVIHARRVLLEAVANVQAGRHPVGDGPPATLVDVVPTDAVIPPAQSEDLVGSPTS